jgi:hypothetical protein
MDVVVWLRSLGLEEYEAAFRNNKIDERVLRNLTQEDLKEIGVGPVGHRRVLLDAIAALRCTSATARSTDAATTSSAPSAPPEDRAERRQVTVMFCVGRDGQRRSIAFSKGPPNARTTKMRTTPITTICNCATAQAAPMHAVTQTQAAVVSPCT